MPLRNFQMHENLLKLSSHGCLISCAGGFYFHVCSLFGYFLSRAFSSCLNGIYSFIFICFFRIFLETRFTCYYKLRQYLLRITKNHLVWNQELWLCVVLAKQHKFCDSSCLNYIICISLVA